MIREEGIEEKNRNSNGSYMNKIDERYNEKRGLEENKIGIVTSMRKEYFFKERAIWNE